MHAKLLHRRLPPRAFPRHNVYHKLRHYISNAASQLLPSSVAGDGWKAWQRKCEPSYTKVNRQWTSCLVCFCQWGIATKQAYHYVYFGGRHLEATRLTQYRSNSIIAFASIYFVLQTPCFLPPSKWIHVIHGYPLKFVNLSLLLCFACLS